MKASVHLFLLRKHGISDGNVYKIRFIAMQSDKAESQIRKDEFGQWECQLCFCMINDKGKT